MEDQLWFLMLFCQLSNYWENKALNFKKEPEQFVGEEKTQGPRKMQKAKLLLPLNKL